ncbi:HNH endonuclease signature motif containing protein [Arthrobacter sp. UCD-GKA]|uniref:HNH endonuclease n=1 Tax=Arthrobacter sp. UCD-GKA TaxID=1913576 RepID=UPI0009F3F758
MDDRDNYACAYCGTPVEHVDHIHPLARGGADAPENMQWACAPCNLSKHDADLFEWRPKLYELVKDWPCIVRELPPCPVNIT